MEPVAESLPERRTLYGSFRESLVKFAEEIVEIVWAGSLVAFNGEQLLELPVALLEDPAVGTFSDMALHIARDGLGEPPVGEIVQ